MTTRKKRITPEQFWKILAENLKSKRSLLLKKYGDKTKYTKSLTSIIEKLGYELGYGAIDREYWPRVDLAYFDKCTDDNWDQYAMEIAIELENDSESWWQEFNKLVAINAGLKVLITYKDGTPASILKDLKSKDQKSLINIYKSRKYYQSDDLYLLVFGPTGCDNASKERDFFAVKFDGKSFTLLEKYNILSE